MKIVLFGAGSDLGVHMDGAHLGPTQLINDLKDFFEGEVVSLMQEEGIIKSRNLSDKRKNKYEVMDFNRRLYRLILEKHEEGELFPITIGGDSSVSIASALASAKVHEDIGIIMFSAHTDYNTIDTTITGNVHGTTLASINGACKEFNDFFDGNPALATKTVVVGARSIDDSEKDTIKYSNITVFSTEDLKQDIDNPQQLTGEADEVIRKTIVEQAFSIASYRTKGVHIIFDLGLIDPDIAPGISSPSVDGLTEEQAMIVCDEILNHFEHVVSFDLVEFNPLRDIGSRKTEQIAVNILAKVIKKAEEKGKIFNKNVDKESADVRNDAPADTYIPPPKEEVEVVVETPSSPPSENIYKETEREPIINYQEPKVEEPVVTPLVEEIPQEIVVAEVTDYQQSPVGQPIVTQVMDPIVTPLDQTEQTTIENQPTDLGYVIAPPIISSVNTPLDNEER